MGWKKLGRMLGIGGKEEKDDTSGGKEEKEKAGMRTTTEVLGGGKTADGRTVVDKAVTHHLDKREDGRKAAGFNADGTLDDDLAVVLGGSRSTLKGWRPDARAREREARAAARESESVLANADLTETGDLSMQTAMSGKEQMEIGGERLEYGREVLTRMLEVLGLRKDLFAFPGEVQARLIPKLVGAQRMTETADAFGEHFEAAGILVESETGVNIVIEMPGVEVGIATRQPETVTLAKKYELAEPYKPTGVGINEETNEWLEVNLNSLGIRSTGIRTSLNTIINKENPSEIEVIAALANAEVDGVVRAHGQLGLISIHVGECPGEGWMGVLTKKWDDLTTEDGQKVWVKEKEEDMGDELDRLLAELDDLGLDSGEAEAVRSVITAATGSGVPVLDEDLPPGIGAVTADDISPLGTGSYPVDDGVGFDTADIGVVEWKPENGDKKDGKTLHGVEAFLGDFDDK